MLQMYGMHPQAGLKAILESNNVFLDASYSFFFYCSQQGNEAPTFFNFLFQTRLIRSQGVEPSLLKGAQVL